jgi:uroporphyrinogen-III synthase
MRLLVTRPQADGERTASVLVARGHEPVLCPLLRIEPVPAALGPGPWDGVLLTSANAARAVAVHNAVARLRVLPALTVGGRTAEAARAAGFASVRSADGDAADLMRLAASESGGRGAKLLYLAGEDRAADLAAALAPAGIAVETVVIYRAAAIAQFPPAIAAALGARRIDGVLHYSRRTADAYVGCARAAGRLDAPVTHYCLAAPVAEPLAAAGIADLRVAARPDESALLAML